MNVKLKKQTDLKEIVPKLENDLQNTMVVIFRTNFAIIISIPLCYTKYLYCSCIVDIYCVAVIQPMINKLY